MKNFLFMIIACTKENIFEGKVTSKKILKRFNGEELKREIVEKFL